MCYIGAPAIDRSGDEESEDDMTSVGLAVAKPLEGDGTSEA